MPLTRLRKVGGSVSVATPPAISEEARIAMVSEVEPTAKNEDGTAAIRSTRQRYRLEDLLAEVDPHAMDTEEDRAWIDDRAVGREII